IIFRNIPNLKLKVEYPLYNNINTRYYSFINNITPIFQVIKGKNYKDKYSKDYFIDNSNKELSEYNIFDYTRYSGKDYSDYGTRFVMGLSGVSAINNINSHDQGGSCYLDFFIGKEFNKYNKNLKENGDFVGNFSLTFNDNSHFIYRFRKDSNFSSILDETGFSFIFPSTRINLLHSSLRNINKYYSDDVKLEENSINQVKLDLSYDFTDKINIGFNSRFNLDRKIDLLYKEFSLSYLHECASFTFSIFDDYTSDKERGVHKINKKYGFTIGLKVLNM
ncbi:MAG TPA: LPS assembly protein LptD, partial [Candidatus Megaira endosymbiont of Hartmannula sinica]|nr:LPS assembly protein LptD [Candidatus Megaera endosymbiont of Hartmannula sinica]